MRVLERRNTWCRRQLGFGPPFHNTYPLCISFGHLPYLPCTFSGVRLYSHTSGGGVFKAWMPGHFPLLILVWHYLSHSLFILAFGALGAGRMSEIKSLVRNPSSKVRPRDVDSPARSLVKIHHEVSNKKRANQKACTKRPFSISYLSSFRKVMSWIIHVWARRLDCRINQKHFFSFLPNPRSCLRPSSIIRVAKTKEWSCSKSRTITFTSPLNRAFWKTE